MIAARCGLVAVAALLAVGGAHATPSGPRSQVDVAKVVSVAVVRARPDAGRIVRLLATRTRWGGRPQELLVLGQGHATDGSIWLRVRLPSRPNGSSGWIRRDNVTLHRVRTWIDVSLAERVLRVFRDGRLVRSIRAVVGAPTTPTPTGLFAVYEVDPQQATDGFLGPWVMQLTAFSDVLDNYGGGPGRVAIHGRGGASLLDPLGTARSHGCIRIDNTAVAWLARTVGPGTPVRIHR